MQKIVLETFRILNISVLFEVGCQDNESLKHHKPFLVVTGCSRK